PANILVYPNPTSSMLTITTDHVLNNACINLVNVSGQLVLSKTNLSSAQTTLDISRFGAGIYFIEIIENGKTSKVKIIKR
ncbi:MAG: T9SS type A sorting domain-containing protein, partial [Bacteroidetes bacterium]|nr:T9SS type A sorting domain-containing protein [Bacteroidota bacterium]